MLLQNKGFFTTLSILALLAGMVLISGCATTPPKPDPSNVGLNFWIKRTTFDLSSVQYIESQNQALARDVFTAHRKMMLENFPAMDKFVFDFSRLSTEVLWREGDLAQVRVYGNAAILNPDGSFKETTQVDDRFFMTYENNQWKVQFEPKWKNSPGANPAPPAGT